MIAVGVLVMVRCSAGAAVANVPAHVADISVAVPTTPSMMWAIVSCLILAITIMASVKLFKRIVTPPTGGLFNVILLRISILLVTSLLVVTIVHLTLALAFFGRTFHPVVAS